MTLETILNIVSEVNGIPVDNLKAKRRLREEVLARNMYFKFAKHFTNCSYRIIGIEVNRGHATVMHGIKTIHQDLETNFLECKLLVDECYKQLVNKSKENNILRDISSIVIQETNLFNLIYNKLYNHYSTKF